MDRMRCTFVTHGLLEMVSQTVFDEASAALAELCALFAVEQREAKPAPAVGERLELDPSVPALRQYGDLWDLLVPDSGQCRTLQGEVIRIAGRVGHEVYDNGGINWDRSFLGRSWTSISVSCVRACRCRPPLWLAPRPPSPP